MNHVKRDVWVGGFFAVAIAALFGVVLVLGQRQSLFHRKVHLRTSFADAAGLIVGTSVRLAGVDVGVVERISFDPDLRVKKVHALLGINSAYVQRIREDSIARLASKGLLGDMVVDIGVGSAEARGLHDGDELVSQESDSLTEVVRSVQDGIGDVRTLAQRASSHLDALLDARTTENVQRAVRSIADLTDEAAHGHGVVHALVEEPRLAEDLRAMGASGRSTLANAAAVVARVDHLIGSPDVQRLPAKASRALDDFADVATQLREGPGLAHDLVYRRSHLIENTDVIAANLRTASDDVVAGRGTFGLLLKDPTVYEDLKLVLGNVRRSRGLRFLVRSAIRHDGLSAVSR